jgi:hypothetical protein
MADRATIRHWYGTRRWRSKARMQLRKDPLCCMCSLNGEIYAAQVADHIEPHHGDYQRFWFGQLQSLCKSHHDSIKKQMEINGYSKEIGLDGFPVDRGHPVHNCGRGGAYEMRGQKAARPRAQPTFAKPYKSKCLAKQI